MVSQEKWDKTKRLIAELEGMVALDCLPLTRLLQIRGFLMYVVHTYCPKRLAASDPLRDFR